MPPYQSAIEGRWPLNQNLAAFVFQKNLSETQTGNIASPVIRRTACLLLRVEQTCRSIWTTSGFDPTQTSSVLFYGPSSLLAVCKGDGSFAARAERRS
jgi:hypothetical protein